MKKEEYSDIKRKILVVDDSEMNRSLLYDMLSGKYEILEAENGLEASAILQNREHEIALMLLDIVMPKMDGFELLAVMNKNGWIKNIPVIIISSETVPAYVEKAYDLGVQDYISRPFDERIVQRRVSNTLMLFVKQKELSNMVVEQFQEREKENILMTDILSNIVESRNGESGLHVLHIRILTEMLLKRLLEKTDKYPLTPMDISVISNASSLHDIGKMALPMEILNKPGRLTAEEFEVMKTHSIEGANLLKDIPAWEKEPLVKMGYEICRWHHERYDGKGYPDGLSGDEIPIAAQVVSVADVYDALRSKRVYKPSYSHEKTIDMIMNGECGVFNPILLECLNDISDDLEEALKVNSGSGISQVKIAQAIEQQFEKGDINLSSRTLSLLEKERMKYRFFANISQEIQFEYTKVPEMLSLSEWSSEYLELPEIIMEPRESVFGTEIFQKEDFEQLLQVLEEEEWKENVLQKDYMISVKGVKRWHRVIAKAIWSETEPEEFAGAIGKIVDVHDEKEKIKNLKTISEQDTLTCLLNHRSAREKIVEKLTEDEELKYILILFDLDGFKQANDQYGHLFGDEVLKHVASTLTDSTRRVDIVARMGGDEFLLFMSYKDETQLPVERIFQTVDTDFKGFHISISMGVAMAKECGRDYETLFHMADVALYEAKKSGKHKYCFYDESYETLQSVLTFGREVETREES